ncbi:MAG TPA: molybdenum cofactor guanylyltransferase [Pyrinomonadaceae bacterium]|nr:molybdenum cofactor guanylyltransferase [Pyrinomonadaceae bacterium]
MFEGFILAGGKSSRMGADKYALEIGGESFLQRAIKTISKSCESVKVVLNQTQNIETDCKIVRDIYPYRGALGGIHAALKNCETKFAVILAVDLPFVTTEAIENLKNFALNSNKYLAFVPRQSDNRPQPLCTIYRAKYCLPTLEKLLNESDSASVRDFLDLVFPKYLEASKLSENENLLFNVNFPNDFNSLKIN